MSKQTRTCLVLLWCILTLPALVQAQQKTDSMQRLLRQPLIDSVRVQTLTELSLAFRQISELDTAMYYARQAVLLAKKTGYRRGEAKATYYMGICYAYRGAYHSADSCYKLAETIFKSLNDRRYASTVLIAFGALKQLQGDHDAALQLFLDALKYKRELHDSASMPAALTNIGNVYNSLDRPGEALRYFNEAHAIHRATGDKTRFCDDWTNMANMHRMLGNSDTALVLIKAAIHLADSLNYVGTLTYSYGIVATIFLDQEQLDSAINYFTKAYEYALAAEDFYMVANHCLNIGSIYAELNKSTLAEQWLTQGLRVAGQVDAKEHIRDAHRLLSEFYAKQKRFEPALDHYKLYIAYRDSVSDVETQKSILRSEIKFQHDKELAVQQAEQDKMAALAASETKRQRLIILLVSVALCFVMALAGILYNRFSVTRKQARLIEEQKREVVQQRDQLEMQNHIIEDKNKSITDSITYAKRIQQALLTSDTLLQQHLSEYFIVYLPKDIVSGDFYWAGASADGRFVLVTGDCTGHGVPGAFMSLLNITYLNEIVGARGISDPGKILDAQREAVIGALNPKGASAVSRDGMDAAVCAFNFSTSELSVAGANNPVWIGRNAEIIEIKTDKQPVGMHTGEMQPFHTQHFTLQKGDMVYTFTDGFADQFGGPSGKKMKYSRFKTQLQHICHLDATEQHKQLTHLFEEWKGKLEQVDDVLIIGVRV